METPCKWRFLILFSTVEDATMLVICSSEGSNISLHKQNSTSKMVNSVFSSTYLPVGFFFSPKISTCFFILSHLLPYFLQLMEMCWRYGLREGREIELWGHKPRTKADLGTAAQIFTNFCYKQTTSYQKISINLCPLMFLLCEFLSPNHQWQGMGTFLLGRSADSVFAEWIKELKILRIGERKPKTLG